MGVAPKKPIEFEGFEPLTFEILTDKGDNFAVDGWVHRSDLFAIHRIEFFYSVWKWQITHLPTGLGFPWVCNEPVYARQIIEKLLTVKGAESSDDRFAFNLKNSSNEFRGHLHALAISGSVVPIRTAKRKKRRAKKGDAS